MQIRVRCKIPVCLIAVSLSVLLSKYIQLSTKAHFGNALAPAILRDNDYGRIFTLYYLNFASSAATQICHPYTA